MKAVRVARLAKRDLDDIIAFSEESFGVAIADRYRRLVRAALLDLKKNP